MAFLLAGLITWAQQGAIIVRDAKTGETIPSAHVCFEGLTSGKVKHCITDLNGKAVNDLNEQTRLAVSYVGYETFLDTVPASKAITIDLKPAILNMSEVVVTAQFTPERADRSIYRVNVINSRQIEQKAATSLNDLLAGESNMRISQGGVLGSSLSMQGLSGENVKFLIDGIPVVGRMNGNIDLNQMNLYNVDHVEVIEGPMSVVYGSNAIAGVINIITKENKSAAFSSFANAYHESIGVYNFDAGVSQRVKKHLFSLNAARNFFGGAADTGISRNQRWKPRRQYNADGYYLYTGGKFRLKASGQYFNELLLDKGPLLLPYFESAFDNHFTTIRTTGKLETSYSSGKDRQWNLIAAYSGYSRIKNRYLKDLTTLEQVLTPNADDQDTTLISNTLLRAWYNRNNQDKQLNYQAGLDLNLESGSGKRIRDEKQEIGDYAAFATLKYNPLKNLSVQPGVRAMYNTKYAAPLIFSMNIKWTPAANWALRTTYARGFKAPALKELYLYFVDINHNVQGNPDLKAEYSHNVNLNLSYNKETTRSYLNAEAGIFYNNINNNITLAPEGGDLYTYVNIGKYISEGLQMNITWSLYPGITAKTGFTASGQAFAFDRDGIRNATYYWSKDFTGSLVLKPQKLHVTISAYYKYTGKAPQVIPNDNKTISVGWVNDFNTLDLSILKPFLNNRLNVSLGGKNLFNVKTVPAIGAGGGAHSGNSDSVNVAWGRTWYVKISCNFNRYK